MTFAIVLSTVAATGALAQDAATPQASGASVRALQQELGVTADGVYGPRTRAAVKRFQRAHGLAVDGVAGPATLAALGLTSQRASSNDDTDTSKLESIAQCESGGNPSAVSADGTYRGKYQFARETWRNYGGTGDPAEASEAAQDRVAARLLAARGTAPWPNCA